MQVPDLVGSAEAADILGVPSPIVTRWKKDGRMPPHAADPAVTTLWYREHVEQLAREGRWAGKRPRTLPLIGTAEAAELLATGKSQISRWKRAGVFPAPQYDRPSATWQGPTLRAGPVWWRKDVEAFARARVQVKEKAAA